MARVISFEMALDNDPEKVRNWEYKALSLKISPKKVAKGVRPTFLVVEKGIGVTQMTVKMDAEGTHFILSENSEFTQADAQRAVGLIGSAMFQIMSERGVIDNVK
jgi:hypothetical protein